MQESKIYQTRLIENCWQVSTICNQTGFELYLSTHYASMSVQYTAIFHGCENDNFQMKFFDFFLIFAQNIDCGYTLELPH